ncbi:hypothetical protein SELR_pSRC400740 (plasmid) [Selenomonas ruminantium subsp. lactilytica TAM6421]|uniref:Uncharacterized protein n=1 Tax=Selenomonas ruminantium subsp. lactilytica (strain NBRC 103574 / TAM6421) TaxID=927704 RepID=I0GVD8_SELRL|nr:hypothetical protein [Selenomonas ruminantium]BAL84725.1 hypothetical protein SELR_pSRC400740 [Selenomonas ruminantium subsp. lactilytica TAM6421]
MIHISIYDGSLKTPFREIGTNISSTATKEEIASEVMGLLKSHDKLRHGETAMQKAYRDE